MYSFWKRDLPVFTFYLYLCSKKDNIELLQH